MGSILNGRTWQNNNMVKHGGWMIFAGCSFTWGQGLWSYCPDTKWHVPTCWEYTDNSDECPIPPNADKFRKEKRFAQIVAERYHANPLVKRHNGGTDEESIRFIDDVKKNKIHPHSMVEFNSDWDNITAVIFQTTQLYRSHFFFHYKGQEYGVRSHPGHQGLSLLEKIIRSEDYNDSIYANHYSLETLPNVDIFLEWLLDNNITMEEFPKLHAAQVIDSIESTFKKLEQEGKVVLMLSWTNEYLEEIKKRPYLEDKFVKLNYLDETFDCIEHLMLKHPNMEIKNDNTKNYECGGDGHPSLLCHQVIADSLIKKLNRIEYTP
jgi:hypothetical protein